MGAQFDKQWRIQVSLQHLEPEVSEVRLTMRELAATRCQRASPWGRVIVGNNGTALLLASQVYRPE